MTASLEEYQFLSFAKYKQKSESRHYLDNNNYLPEPGSDLVLTPGGNLELQSYKLCSPESHKRPVVLQS